MNKKKIAVIGGGASGLLSALAAARSGANVTIFEANDKLGKKILATGNGKCNISNIDMDARWFHTNLPVFVEKSLLQFSTKETIRFFNSIGIYTKVKNNGVYPITEQSSTVLDALVFAIQRNGIEVITNTWVHDIKKTDGKYFVEHNTTAFDRIIIATGLFAGAHSKAAEEIYHQLIEKNYKTFSILPALCGFKCEETYYKNLHGIRVFCRIRSYSNSNFLEEESGELQLTKYGVSGIPIFQLSSNISREIEQSNAVTLRIDYIPFIEADKVQETIKERMELFQNASIYEFLNGVVHHGILLQALKQLDISQDSKINMLPLKKILSIFNLLKNWETKIVSSNDYGQAQVCTGGVDLEEINHYFQTKKDENIYIIGELLNVDGICGGYNLQWAWTSGQIAGTHAALN